jgi:hypothetical protein
MAKKDLTQLNWLLLIESFKEIDSQYYMELGEFIPELVIYPDGGITINYMGHDETRSFDDPLAAWMYVIDNLPVSPGGRNDTEN